MNYADAGLNRMYSRAGLHVKTQAVTASFLWTASVWGSDTEPNALKWRPGYKEAYMYMFCTQCPCLLMFVILTHSMRLLQFTDHRLRLLAFIAKLCSSIAMQPRPVHQHDMHMQVGKQTKNSLVVAYVAWRSVSTGCMQWQ